MQTFNSFQAKTNIFKKIIIINIKCIVFISETKTFILKLLNSSSHEEQKDIFSRLFPHTFDSSWSSSAELWLEQAKRAS